MNCPTCQHENREGILFCEECGSALPRLHPHPDEIEKSTCSQCGNKNRAGVRFCETCGFDLLTITTKETNYIGKTCANCGKLNRSEVKFCEECGNSLDEVKKKRIRGKKVRKPISPRLKKFYKTAAIFLCSLAGVLFILFLIGRLTTPPSASPVYREDHSPVVVVKGINLDGGIQLVQTGQVSVETSSQAGIQRVEMYADGQLVAGDNLNPNVEGEPNQPFIYFPPIDKLPAGEHEVIVVITDGNGKTSSTSVIPVVTEKSISGQTEAESVLQIEPPISTLPAPSDFKSSINVNAKMAELSWGGSTAGVSLYRIYVRWPGTSSFVLVGSPPVGTNSFSVPLDQYGIWQFSISVVDLTGREGSLAQTSLEYRAPRSNGVFPDAKEIISFGILDVQAANPAVKYLYAYVRLGGEENRFQRIPEVQGTYLQTTSGGKFNATIPGFDLPVSKPLMVEVELWGWAGDELLMLGAASKSIAPADYKKTAILFQNPHFSASLLLQTRQVDAQQGDGTGGVVQNTFKGINLPPPENLHYAFYGSECELVTSRLGKLRNVLRDFCRSSLNFGMRSFLIWTWPAEGGEWRRFSEADLTGFEMKFVKTDASGVEIGSAITSLPFPELRSAIRDMDEVNQEVVCGVKKTWYLRAVGKGSASEWVYAGSIDAKNCPPPTPTQNASTLEDFPPYNGCGGQSDKFPDLVPDLIFEQACNIHDQCYERSWSGKTKVSCDNEFLDNLLDECHTTIIGLVTTEYCTTAAFTYYEAVNLVGRFFYNGDIDAMDCITTPAVDVKFCLLGSSPEILNSGIDVAKTAYNAGEMIVKNGYEYTKDGVVTLGKATLNGLETMKDGIVSGGSWVYKKVCRWSWCQ